MNAIYQIFFIFLLISYITTCGPTDGTVPKKADDCKDDSISEANKKLDFTHCCYVDYGIEELNQCKELTSYQYKNFGKYFKEYKKSGGRGDDLYAYDLKMDCYSYNMKLYVLSFISLFLLF